MISSNSLDGAYLTDINTNDATEERLDTMSQLCCVMPQKEIVTRVKTQEESPLKVKHSEVGPPLVSIGIDLREWSPTNNLRIKVISVMNHPGEKCYIHQQWWEHKGGKGMWKDIPIVIGE